MAAAHFADMERLRAEHAENAEFLKNERQAEVELQTRRVREEMERKMAILEDRLLN